MNIIQFWKQFDIGNAINLIHEACEDVKPASVNGCWKNIWPECVHDFSGFMVEKDQFRDHLAKIVALARQVDVEGFSDLQESEVEELLEGHGALLTDDDLEELTKSGSEEEEEEDVQEQRGEEEGFTLARLQEFFRTVKALQSMSYDLDTSMVRSLKFAKDLDAATLPYRTIFDEMKKNKRQLEIPMFFKPTVRPSSPVSPSSPVRPSSPALPLQPTPPVALHPAEDSDGGDPDDPPPLPELQ